MFAVKTSENKTDILNDTINMLQELNLDELEAVRSIINVIVRKEDNYYKPLTEAELIARALSNMMGLLWMRRNSESRSWRPMDCETI